MSDIEGPMKITLYGRSSTGKTTLACSFPKPLLLLDVKDNGLDSVSDVEGVKVLRVESIFELEQVFWMLSSDKNKYKTVVIDTMSQVQEMCVAEVAAAKSKDPEKAGDWGTMTKQMWGDVASKQKSLITRYRDLKMNVVFIAQDRVFGGGESDEDDGQIMPEVGPRLSPSVASHLNAAVNIIGNTFIRESIKKKRIKGKLVERRSVQYCLRLGPNSVYVTKVRKPKSQQVPAFIEDPSYEDLHNYVKGQ